jgi:hypothetical protein
MDTIPPRVTVETPHAARAGRLLTIHFAATDNDLVEACTLSVDGRPIGRVSWPASTFRWHLPAGRGGVVRITVTAVDRAGNRAAAVSTTRTIR